MKTLFTLLSFLILSQFGFTQPVISDIVTNFGDQMIYNQKDGAPSPGSSGADVAWDFSGLTIDQYSSNYMVNHPGDVEGSGQFPDATMVWTVDIGFGILNSFISFENNMLTNYGSISSSSGFTSGVVYENPEVQFVYPINYQDTGSDTYAGSVVIPSGESPITGTSSSIVDGYGTIITPYGTYDNVLRITTTKVQIVTSFGIETTSNITETTWYSADYPVPVFLMVSSIDTFMGTPLDSSSTVTALVGYSDVTGIDKIYSDALFEIYPNPAIDYITITSDFQGVAEFIIFNIEGKLISQKTVRNSDKVDLSQLQAGYYIARLTINNKRYAQNAFVIK